MAPGLTPLMDSATSSSLPAGKRTLWAWAVATFFGAGLMKPGPGTWGSAAAALLWFAAGYGLHLSLSELSWFTLLGAVTATGIGVLASNRVESESQRKDPGHIVIDEVAGQWIALIHSGLSLSHLLAAFLFFRIFDILKPWPARRLESLPRGWGIMFDDVAAGVYALLLVQVLQGWIGR
jgi:phosphatidylglycerophosphatase A